jgi:hypothetical protein
MAYTSIQISVETREKLMRLKSYARETYDELLTMLISLVPYGDTEGKYSDEFRASLLRSLSDIKQGRVHQLADVKKQLGIE